MSILRDWRGSRRARSVRDDWLAGLPEAEHRLFAATVAKLEASYAMLSVALDEALALRSKGTLGLAREQASVSAELVERLAAKLQVVLAAIDNLGRHFGTLPDVTALDSGYFREHVAQRAAIWNSLLHGVLFSSRPRFFHKVHTLERMVDELAREFCDVAEDIVQGTSIRPSLGWKRLDDLHFDLNTCLRETIVVLKSFLCALPAEALTEFQRNLELLVRPAPPLREPTPADAALRHRLAGRFRRK